MIDERTSRLNLALPVNSNTLKDDCERLRETISTLDAKVATVDVNGKIPVEQIPAVAITDTFPVASQAEMLALNAQKGDVAIRSDISKSFILMAEPATALANWKEFANDALVQLAQIDGSSFVGSASYADIRSYTGTGKAIQCYGRQNIFDGANGLFRRDDTDTTSADNDGTILVDAAGRRWKRVQVGHVNVRWFGAKGDWNGTASTGADDTAAVQAAINALGATYRKGGLREVFFPTGNFKITNLTVPASLEFGVQFRGEGRYASIIWADQTNTNPAITSQIEFVHFDGLGLFGSLSNGTDSAAYKQCFFRGQLASKAPDVDVTFTNCLLGYSIDFVQAYGRGVVIDSSCDAVFCTNLVNVVCDPSLVFPGGVTNAYQTGMRNYNVSPRRCDVVSRLFTVTGTAAWKDYINDVTVTGSNLLSCDRLVEFTDATITNLTVNGVSALNSFASGMIVGKRLINANIDATASKQYNRDAASTAWMSGVVKLTGPASGVTIRGIYRDLVGQVLQVGAVSASVIIDIQAPNLGSDGNEFRAVRGANVIGYEGNIMASGGTGAGPFYPHDTMQSDPKIKFNAYGVKFERAGVAFTPLLRIGGTAQSAAFASGTYRVEGGLAYVEIGYSYNRAATTTSEVSITLPVAPAAEYPSLSAAFSGEARIKFSTLKSLMKAEVAVSSASILLYKTDGTTAKEVDLGATFALGLSAVFPV